MFKPTKIVKFDHISEPSLFNIFEFDFDKFLELFTDDDPNAKIYKESFKARFDTIKKDLLQLLNRKENFDNELA